MEAARPTFRADPVASAVIVVVAGYLLHEGFKGLQLTGCHVAHFVFSPFLAAPPSSARGRLFQLSGNKKRGFASCSEMENETNPLSFIYSNDFSDSVKDTEHQPDDQGKPSDKTADD